MQHSDQLHPLYSIPYIQKKSMIQKQAARRMVVKKEWVLCLSLFLQLSFVIGNEVAILTALRKALVDPNNALNSWDETLVNPCTWFHITCTSNQTVGQINLGHSNLSGHLVPDLGGLSSLESLELYDNSISGSIPSELGNLTNLTSLDLYNNQLTGHIPKTLGQLGKLSFCRLSCNSLTGTIPPELGNLVALTELDLFVNDLSGTIPNTLGSLSNLVSLKLNVNRLTGFVPQSLANLKSLTTLDCTSNSLSGTIKLDHGAFLKITCASFQDNPDLKCSIS